MGAKFLWSESSHQMQIGAIAAPKAEFVADVRISRNLFQLGFWILYFTCTAGSFWCQYVAWFDPTLGCSLFFSAIPCQQGITIQSHWRRGAISRSWFWFYSESAYTCIQHWFIRDPNLDGPCLNAQGCRIQASVRNVLLFLSPDIMYSWHYVCWLTWLIRFGHRPTFGDLWPTHSLWLPGLINFPFSSFLAHKDDDKDKDNVNDKAKLNILVR